MSARCSSCGARARKLRRAHVLRGPAIKPGRVCGACARTGWLLVFAAVDDVAERPRARSRELRGVLADELKRASS